MKDDMRKHAIYLLEDLSDRDFECFVFIDPTNVAERDPFLKELFKVITEGKDTVENTKEFADEKHKEELMKWIGTKNENDTDVNPYNWLKIAIERFPYRLFVLTKDDSVIKSDKVPEFLKKRICFIGDSSELKERLNTKDFDRFVINLFCSWLNHLLLGVRGKNPVDYLQIFYGTGEGRKYFKPDTLPKALRESVDEGNNNRHIRIYLNKKLQSGSPGAGKVIELTAKNRKSLREAPYSGELVCVNDNYDNYQDDAQGYTLFLTQHQSIYFYSEDNNPASWGTFVDDMLVKKTIFSEGLTGAMSYFNQVYSTRNTLESFASKLFVLKYAENALLRVGICDERFQEWWLKKHTKYRGYLYQARIIPVYMDGQNVYDQKAFPEDNGLANSHQKCKGFYGLINSKENEGNFLSVCCPDNARDLWQDEKGIDMLIIHQGILEQWADSDKSTGTITRKILKLKEKIPFIIVTSGRGRPDNVPYGIKFLPFSNLESCMIGNYFERLTLLRQIMSISEQI